MSKLWTLCKIKTSKIKDLRFLEIGTKIQETSQSLKLKYRSQHFNNAYWSAGQWPTWNVWKTSFCLKRQLAIWLLSTGWPLSIKVKIFHLWWTPLGTIHNINICKIIQLCIIFVNIINCVHKTFTLNAQFEQKCNQIAQYSSCSRYRTCLGTFSDLYKECEIHNGRGCLTHTESYKW